MSYAALNVAEIVAIPSERSMRPHLCNAASFSPLSILLVEDDASDVMLTENALDDANMDYELHTLPNGEQVLPYLQGKGKYRDEPKPDMLMLDLSLPAKDGFEVLAELSGKPERFGDLPIVILTGDSHCGFLKYSYDLNIVAYVTKPCTAKKIQNVFSTLV